MTRNEQLAREFESHLIALLRILNPTSDEDPLSDLSIPQLRFMRAIAERPRTPSELMDVLGSSASSISQIASRLEDSGFVERHPDSDDRRRTHIHLSATGRKLFEVRRAIRLERAERALSKLDAAERELLTGLMERITEHRMVSELLDMETVQ